MINFEGELLCLGYIIKFVWYITVGFIGYICIKAASTATQNENDIRELKLQCEIYKKDINALNNYFITLQSVYTDDKIVEEERYEEIVDFIKRQYGHNK